MNEEKRVTKRLAKLKKGVEKITDEMEKSRHVCRSFPIKKKRKELLDLMMIEPGTANEIIDLIKQILTKLHETALVIDHVISTKTRCKKLLQTHKNALKLLDRFSEIISFR